jgi:hypothetical protein
MLAIVGFHFASNFATRFGVVVYLALPETKSSPKKNSICTLHTPGDATLPSFDENAIVAVAESPGWISNAGLKYSGIDPSYAY